MSLRTERLGGTTKEPLSLEAVSQLAPASCLLWHLERSKRVSASRPTI